jgi:hypothetical protein
MHNRSEIGSYQVRRPPATRSDHASASPDQRSPAQLSDDELAALFENLAPPPKLIAKKRLEKLLPALAIARKNGNGVKELAEKLKEQGIDVSVVTLRAKLDAYEKRQKDPSGTDHAQDDSVAT